MKQLILLILISFTLLNAKSIQLTNEDLKKIDSHPYSKAIKLRLLKYIELKKKIKNMDLIRQLNHVNTFYNRILPVHDATKYQVDDHWATPKEFIIEGRGDCEDYAISKYFTLKESGISVDKLFLSVVKVKGATNYHMVLTYLENLKSMPLVLDNLSFKVLPFDKRTDLEPQFIFNEKQAFLLKDKKVHKKVRINWGKVDKWQLLLDRVYKRNE